MSKQQTAIEWLDKELWSLRLQLRGGEISIQDFGKQEIKLLEQANIKAMEKEQSKKDFIAGMEFIPVDPNRYNEDAEQYYNETFKSE